MENKCVMCGEIFTDAELAGLRDMGEEYHMSNGKLFCPDCWDSINRIDLTEQFLKLLPR